MCTVVRSFMPVGQGAFYVEQFTSCNPRINLVFDCGSDTNLKLLHNNIDEVFRKDETIHAVFISHLHEDHINGLEYLISKCNVKKIFLPLLDNKEKKLTLLRYLSSKASYSTDDFFYKFVNDPYAYLFSKDKRANIYYVLPNNADRLEYGDEYHIIQSGENVSKHIKEIPSYYMNWEIVPFNFRNKERTEQLITQLEQVFYDYFPDNKICINEEFDLGYYWKNYPYIRNRLKKAYENVNGSLNTNSMVVFSGAIDTYQHFCLLKTDDCYQCDNCHANVYKSGCLYTGDYDCSGKNKYSDLNKAFINYWESIGCITIPHHGSQRNYDERLTDNKNIFCIISSGNKNNYNHPHATVMRDLLQKRILTFLINENNSKFQTYIYC